MIFIHNNKNYENRIHTTKDILYSFYKCEISENFLGVSPHWHREFEINYILEGRGIYRINDKEYHAEAGDIIFIQPENLHSIYSDGGIQVYNTLVFSPDLLNGGLGRAYKEYLQPIEIGETEIIPCCFKKSLLGYNEIRECVQSIFENAGVCALNDIILKSQLLKLIYLFAEYGFIKKCSTTPNIHSLKPTMEYIKERYNEQLTIKELAAFSHLSESYFMAKFKMQIGMSTIEYINRLRIEKAQNMLRKSTMSVTDIAFDCGYKNISNFNRNFKKITGTNPLSFRRDI